jgi:hypothetical protein
MSGDFFSSTENAMTDDPLDASNSPRATEGRPEASSTGLQVILASDFAQHGADAVKALRLERPHDYLKLVAAFTPKDTPPPTNPTVEDMTDDEFIRVLNALRPRAPGGGPAPDGDTGA